ncbi:MAG: hypothetical protein JWP01_955 [Myxococcales bacterium]|nr:hypothetical protein [Myxococcales bacterium]
MLRRLVLVLVACGALASALGFAPSVELYEDSNACIADPIVHMFMFAPFGGHLDAVDQKPCEENWVLTETRTPVDSPLANAFYVAIVLLPGLLVWFRPRLLFALLWSAWALGVTYVMLAATFNLRNLFKHAVHSPLAHAFDAAAATVLVGVTVVVPVGWMIFALVTRTGGAPDELAP